MCNPVAVAVVSTLVAAQQSNKATKEQNRSRNAFAQQESDRQGNYQNDIEDRVNEDISKMGREGYDDTQQQLLDQRMAVIDKNYDTDISQYIPALNSPREVNTEYGRQLNQALTKGRQQAIAKAKLGSYNDVDAANALRNLESQMDISRYFNFSRGSSNAYGYELDSANNKGARARFNAEVARGVGSIAAGQAGKNSRYKRVPGDADYPYRDPKYNYYSG